MASSNGENVTRDKLMDACVEAAGLYGIVNFKIKHVAECSGVSRQTLYNHYRNKSDLLQDTMNREGLRIAVACGEEIKAYPLVEDKFVKGLLYIYQTLPANPVLRAVIDNNRDFFSFVNLENYSLKEFGTLCLLPVFEEYPALTESAAELTEYWSRSTLSLLMLPSEEEMSLKEIEGYVRRRLVPGLGLAQYQV